MQIEVLMKMVLETERTLLRHLAGKDLDALSAIYADAEVRRYFPDGPLDREQTRAEIAWFVRARRHYPNHGLWAIIERGSGALIGRAGLLRWTIDGRREIEIAYLLAKQHWRRGLGREIATALVRHGFDRLQLPRLIALIHADNVASIRTAESAGLAFERTVEFEDGTASLYAVHRERR
jgi:ribosomal-protein-alanine N-acetyltransferase